MASVHPKNDRLLLLLLLHHHLLLPLLQQPAIDQFLLLGDSIAQSYRSQERGYGFFKVDLNITIRSQMRKRLTKQ